MYLCNPVYTCKLTGPWFSILLSWFSPSSRSSSSCELPWIPRCGLCISLSSSPYTNKASTLHKYTPKSQLISISPLLMVYISSLLIVYMSSLLIVYMSSLLIVYISSLLIVYISSLLIVYISSLLIVYISSLLYFLIKSPSSHHWCFMVTNSFNNSIKPSP